MNLFYSHNIDKDRWNKFVLDSINGTVFNTIEWLQVWENSFPNAKAIILIDESWQFGIVFIKIKKFFDNYYSMPYGCYGGILTVHRQVGDQLVNLIKYLPKSYGMIGITDFYDINKLGCGSPLYKTKRVAKFDKILCKTHIIELGDSIDSIVNNLKPEKKRIIKQLKKYEVKVDLLKEEEIPICYEMLIETAKRHKTKPRFSIIFYKNIFKFMGKYLRCCIAKKNDRPLSCMINFVYKDTIFYWEGGSYDNGLQYRPNDAIIYENIKWGIQNGYKYYNLGSSPTTGLIKFKESWGATPKYYPFYYKYNLFFKLVKNLCLILKG